MKISFHEITNSLLRHCIIHLISRDKEVGDKMIKETHENDGMIDLTFTMNGVDLPILEWFNRLDENIESDVEERAEEMIRESLNDIENDFSEIVDDARDKIYEKFDIKKKEEW